MNFSDLPTRYHLEIEYMQVSGRYNKGCEGCGAKQNGKGESMPFERIRKILEGEIEFYKQQIILSLDEPTLYQDGDKHLGDVVKLLLTKLGYVSIITRGFDEAEVERARLILSELEKVRSRVGLNLSFDLFGKSEEIVFQRADRTLGLLLEYGGFFV